MQAELVAVREEARCSQAKLEALRDSLKEFQEFFRSSTTLTKIVRDKIFLAIFNLYFFNLLRGEYIYIYIYIDLSVAFHLVRVPDFVDVFLVRAIAAQ